MADKLNGILISEILADNAGGSALDTDGDGNANKADEYVELQNASGSAVSLDGFELWSEKEGLLYSFGSSDSIAAGGTATVVGEYTGTPPADYYDAGESNSVNWLPDGENNKFDSIFLVDTNTGDYIVLSYGAPPRAPTLPSGFPGTTRIGAGESIDSNSPNGTAFVRNADGDFVEGTPNPDTPGVPCFVAGTWIETSDGRKTVESLKLGDLIQTRDAGVQPVLGLRKVVIPVSRLKDDPALRPVRVPGALFGTTGPLTISPNHCILVVSGLAELLFGEAEVLIPAKHFVGRGAVEVTLTGKPVVYYHLLLADHQIVTSNGVWTESLFRGDLIADEASWFREWCFAKGATLEAITHATTARPVLKRFEAEVLLDRMQIVSVDAQQVA